MSIRCMALWSVLIAALCLAVACDSGGEAESAKAAPATQQAQAATAAPVATATPEPAPITAAAPAHTSTPTPTPAPPATPEPTPSPTAASAPTTTPVPTATPEPASAAVSVDDFDQQRLIAEVIGSPPRTLRMALDMDAPEGVTLVFVVELQAEEGVSRVLFEASTPLGAVKYEIIATSDRMYVSGGAGGETTGWITAEGAENPFAETLALASTAAFEGQLTAVAVEPCRGGRTCFVLEDAATPGMQVFIDTATYYPVTVINTDPPPGQPATIEIDWNEDFEIAIPADAEEVTADEIGAKLLELFLALGALQPG